MNLCTKEEQAHRHRKQIYSCHGGKGRKEEQIRSMELADTNYCT